jgi:hypothetical protein
MPKKPEVFAKEIQARMQSESKQVLTMLWSEFYRNAGIQRFGDKYSDNIHSACVALGIVVGHGNNVVTFCYDANFSA